MLSKKRGGIRCQRYRRGGKHDAISQVRSDQGLPSHRKCLLGREAEVPPTNVMSIASKVTGEQRIDLTDQFEGEESGIAL